MLIKTRLFLTLLSLLGAFSASVTLAAELALPELIAKLENAQLDPEGAESAALQIKYLGTEAHAAADALFKCVKTRNHYDALLIRCQSALLKVITTAEKEVIQKMLASSDFSQRRIAFDLMDVKRLQTLRPEFVLILQDSMDSVDEDIERQVTEAIVKLDLQELTAALQRKAASSKRTYFQTALQKLAEKKIQKSTVMEDQWSREWHTIREERLSVAELLPYLKSSAEHVQTTAAIQLSEMGNSQGAAYLVNFYKTWDAGSREKIHLITIIQENKSEETVAFLKGELHSKKNVCSPPLPLDQCRPIRGAARRALEKIGTLAALEALQPWWHFW